MFKNLIKKSSSAFFFSDFVSSILRLYSAEIKVLRFYVLIVEFNKVRCFYELINGYKWLNQLKFGENRRFRSSDILKIDFS